MKNVLKYTLWIMITGLLIGNVSMFINGIQTGEKTSKYEREIARLKTENAELETKVYEESSLQKASSMAAELNFTKKSTPVHFDNLNIATNIQER
ncbi:MAG: hypothetical protein WCO06_05345 [Candidatus Roizmanbacteria bacterium]